MSYRNASSTFPLTFPIDWTLSVPQAMTEDYTDEAPFVNTSWWSRLIPLPKGLRVKKYMI